MELYDRSILTEVKAGHEGHGLLIERDGYVKGQPDMIQQIREDITNHKEFVIPDHFVVSALFQKYGIKNANERIYPEDILRPQVEKYIATKIKGFGNSAIGALDHPQSSGLSLHDVTHKILDLRWEKHTLMGELELHLSPGYRRYGVCSTTGDLAANLILDDILIGVSSRGVGDVEKRYGTFLVTEYELICWDIVAEPSTPNAYISTNAQSLNRFIENKEEDETKMQLTENNKYSKLLALLG